jgi:hypothetical protein
MGNASGAASAVVYRFPSRRQGWSARVDAAVRELDQRRARFADGFDAAVGAAHAALIAGGDAFKAEWARRPTRSERFGVARPG